MKRIDIPTLSLILIVLFLMGVISYQGKVVELQRTLIRQILTDPCPGPPPNVRLSETSRVQA